MKPRYSLIITTPKLHESDINVARTLIAHGQIIRLDPR